MIFTVLNKGNEHLFETSFVLPTGKTETRVHFDLKKFVLIYNINNRLNKLMICNFNSIDNYKIGYLEIRN